MKLIGSIISKNLIEAEQLFIKKMAVIAEAKIEEKKKMISSSIYESKKNNKKDEDEEDEQQIPNLPRSKKNKNDSVTVAMLKDMLKKRKKLEKRKRKVNEQRMLPSGEVEMPSGEVVPQSLAKQRRGLAEKET